MWMKGEFAFDARISVIIKASSCFHFLPGYWNKSTVTDKRPVVV